MRNCFLFAAHRSLFSLLVLVSLAVPAVWAEDAAIKTPQACVLTFVNGRSVRGTLLSIDSERVRFQLPIKDTVPATYKRSQIRSLRTTQGVFAIDPATGQVRAAGVQPATKLDPRKEKPGVAGRFPGAQTVEAEGVDEDADKALQDAFRAAVRKVVGTMVDAETLVKDEKVIRDQVLTYSDGIIKGGYKELSRKRVEGLWHIKISATVVRRSLAARLQKAKVFVKEVEGKDLAAAVMTRKEARARATELLEKTLAEMPKIMAASVLKPDDRDYDEDKGTLHLEVAVQADPVKYKVFVEKLVNLLDKIQLAQDASVVNAVQQPLRRNEINPTWGPERKSRAAANRRLPANQKGWYLWALTNANPPQWTQTRWNVYLVDADQDRSLAGLQGNLVLQTSLLDADGKVLGEDEKPLIARYSGLRWLIATGPQNVVLAPLAVSTTFTYQPAQTYRLDIKLPEAQLKQLKEIKCVVSLRKGAPSRPGRKKGR